MHSHYSHGVTEHNHKVVHVSWQNVSPQPAVQKQGAHAATHVRIKW